MRTLSTREFRAKLAEIIKAGEPVVLGDAYTFRAVFIPISEEPRWYDGYKAHLAAAKRKARAVLAELEGKL